MSWFNCLKRRKIATDSSFHIYYQENKLAILKFAFSADMFWHYFDLQPLSEDTGSLELLYSVDFWLGNEIILKGAETNSNYEFCIACIEQAAQWLDENGKKVSISDRPQQVLLRGPYPKIVHSVE